MRAGQGGTAMKRVAARLVGTIGAVGALVCGMAALDAQETPEIKIGAFMPISGISADVGAQIKAGTEVAVERMQAQGISLGGKPHRVRVIWYDDEGKADVGLSALTRALTVGKVHVAAGVLPSDVAPRGRSAPEK